MKKSAVIFMLGTLFSVALFSGCMPTPESEIVQNKGDIIIEHFEDDEVINAFENIDDVWKEKIEKQSNFTINIDADIILPKSDLINIYQIERSFFCEDEVKKIADALLGTDYMADGSKWTKSQLTELLVKYKALYQEGNEEISLDEYEANVDDLERRIKEAPETVEEINITDYINTFSDRGYLYLTKDTGNSKLARLRITNSDMNTKVVFNDSKGDNFIAIDYPIENMKIGLGKEDAIIKADELLLNMNIDYMKVCFVAAGANFEEEINEVELEPQCYLLYYTREIDGIQINYDYRDGLTTSDTNQLSKPLAYESIVVSVDSNGVRTLDWNGYLDSQKIQKTYSNVLILPFDAIKEILEENLYINYAAENTNTKIICEISEIRLGLTRIIAKDSNDKFLLIPVWDFYGNVKVINESNIENQYFQCSEISSLITINAIDGTIINRYLGY